MQKIFGRTNMKMTAGILLVFIFLIISILHFYWAFGGSWALNQVTPTTVEGRKIIEVTPLASMVVGIGLLAMAFYYYSEISSLGMNLPQRINVLIQWLIPFIFLARAIGDMKYVGFVKQVTDTDFGKLDSLIYSPLCLVISVLGVIFALSK